jgi:hypothetical protein
MAWSFPDQSAILLAKFLHNATANNHLGMMLAAKVEASPEKDSTHEVAKPSWS